MADSNDRRADELLHDIEKLNTEFADLEREQEKLHREVLAKKSGLKEQNASMEKLLNEAKNARKKKEGSAVSAPGQSSTETLEKMAQDIKEKIVVLRKQLQSEKIAYGVSSMKKGMNAGKTLEKTRNELAEENLDAMIDEHVRNGGSILNVNIPVRNNKGKIQYDGHKQAIMHTVVQFLKDGKETSPLHDAPSAPPPPPPPPAPPKEYEKLGYSSYEEATKDFVKKVDATNTRFQQFITMFWEEKAKEYQALQDALTKRMKHGRKTLHTVDAKGNPIKIMDINPGDFAEIERIDKELNTIIDAVVANATAPVPIADKEQHVADMEDRADFHAAQRALPPDSPKRVGRESQLALTNMEQQVAEWEGTVIEVEDVQPGIGLHLVPLPKPTVAQEGNTDERRRKLNLNDPHDLLTLLTKKPGTKTVQRAIAYFDMMEKATAIRGQLEDINTRREAEKDPAVAAELSAQYESLAVEYTSLLEELQRNRKFNKTDTLSTILQDAVRNGDKLKTEELPRILNPMLGKGIANELPGNFRKLELRTFSALGALRAKYEVPEELLPAGRPGAVSGAGVSMNPGEIEESLDEEGHIGGKTITPGNGASERDDQVDWEAEETEEENLALRGGFTVDDERGLSAQRKEQLHKDATADLRQAKEMILEARKLLANPEELAKVSRGDYLKALAYSMIGPTDEDLSANPDDDAVWYNASEKYLALTNMEVKSAGDIRSLAFQLWGERGYQGKLSSVFRKNRKLSRAKGNFFKGLRAVGLDVFPKDGDLGTRILGLILGKNTFPQSEDKHRNAVLAALQRGEKVPSYIAGTYSFANDPEFKDLITKAEIPPVEQKEEPSVTMTSIIGEFLNANDSNFLNMEDVAGNDMTGQLQFRYSQQLFSSSGSDEDEAKKEELHQLYLKLVEAEQRRQLLARLLGMLRNIGPAKMHAEYLKKRQHVASDMAPEVATVMTNAQPLSLDDKRPFLQGKGNTEVAADYFTQLYDELKQRTDDTDSPRKTELFSGMDEAKVALKRFIDGVKIKQDELAAEIQRQIGTGVPEDDPSLMPLYERGNQLWAQRRSAEGYYYTDFPRYGNTFDVPDSDVLIDKYGYSMNDVVAEQPGKRDTYVPDLFQRLNYGFLFHTGDLKDFRTEKKDRLFGFRTNESQTGFQQLLDDADLMKERFAFARQRVHETALSPVVEEETIKNINILERNMARLAQIEGNPEATSEDEIERRKIALESRSLANKVSKDMRWKTLTWESRQHPGEEDITPEASRDIAEANALLESAADNMESESTEKTSDVIQGTSERLDLFLSEVEHAASSKRGITSRRAKTFAKTGQSTTFMFGEQGQGYINRLELPEDMKGLVTDDNRQVLMESRIIIEKMLADLAKLEDEATPDKERKTIQTELLAFVGQLRKREGGETVLELLQKVYERLNKHAERKHEEANGARQAVNYAQPISDEDTLFNVVTETLARGVTTPSSVAFTEWQGSDENDRMKAGTSPTNLIRTILRRQEMPNLADETVILNPMETLLDMNMAEARDEVANPGKYTGDHTPDWGDLTRSPTMNWKSRFKSGSIAGHADPAEIYDALTSLRQNSSSYSGIIGLGKFFSDKTSIQSLLKHVAKEKQEAFLEAAQKITESSLVLQNIGLPTELGDLSEVFDIHTAIRRVDNQDEMEKIETILLDALLGSTATVQPARPIPPNANATNSASVTDLLGVLGNPEYEEAYRQKDLAITSKGPGADTQQQQWIKRLSPALVGTVVHAMGEGLLKGKPASREDLVKDILNNVSSSWRKLAEKNTNISKDTVPVVPQEIIDYVIKRAETMMASNPFTGLQTTAEGSSIEQFLVGGIEDLNVRGKIDYSDKSMIVDYKTSQGDQAWTDENGNVLETLRSPENTGSAAIALRKAMAQIAIYSSLLGGQHKGQIRHVYIDKDQKAHTEIINLTDELVAEAESLAKFVLASNGILHPEQALGHLVGPTGQTVPAPAQPAVEEPLITAPPIVPPVEPPPTASVAPEEPERQSTGTTFRKAGTVFYNHRGEATTPPTNNKTIPQFGNEFHDNKFFNNTFYDHNLGGAAGSGPSVVSDVPGGLTDNLMDVLTDIRTVLTHNQQGQRGSPESFNALKNMVSSWTIRNPDLNALTTQELTKEALYGFNLTDNLGDEKLRPTGNMKETLDFARGQMNRMRSGILMGNDFDLSRVLKSPFTMEGTDPVITKYLDVVQQWVIQRLKQSFADNPTLDYVSTDTQREISLVMSAAIGKLGDVDRTLVGTEMTPEDSIAANYKEMTPETASQMLAGSYARNAARVRTGARFNDNYLRQMANVRELTYSARGLATGILGYNNPLSSYVDNFSSIIQNSLYGSSSVSDILRHLPQQSIEHDKEYIGALGLRQEANDIQQIKIDPLSRRRQQILAGYDAQIDELDRRIKTGDTKGAVYQDENGEIQPTEKLTLQRLKNQRQKIDTAFGLGIKSYQKTKDDDEAAANIGIKNAQGRAEGLSNFYQKFGQILTGVAGAAMMIAQGVQLYNKWARGENETTLESQKLTKEFASLRLGVSGVTQSITSLSELITAASKIDKDFATTTKDYQALQTYQRAQTEIIFAGTERRQKTVLFEGDTGTKLAKDVAQDWEMVSGNSLNKITTRLGTGTVGQNYLSIAKNIGSFVDMNNEERIGRYVVAGTSNRAPTIKEGVMATDEEKQTLLEIATVVKATNGNGMNLPGVIKTDANLQLIIANELGKQQLAAMKAIAGSTSEMEKNAQSSAFTNLLFQAQARSQKNIFESPKDIDEYAKNNPDMLISQIALGNLGSSGDIVSNTIGQQALANWTSASTKYPNIKGMDASVLNSLLNDNSNPGMATALRSMNKGEDYTTYYFGQIFDYLKENKLLGDAETSKDKYIATAKTELKKQLKDSIPTSGMFSYQQWQVYDKLSKENPDTKMVSPGGDTYTYATYASKVKEYAQKDLQKDLDEYTKELAGTKTTSPDYYKLVSQINQTRQALADLSDAAKLTTTWFNIAGAIVRPTKAIVENNIYPNLTVYMDGVDVTDKASVMASFGNEAPKPLRGGNPIVENFRQRHNLDP